MPTPDTAVPWTCPCGEADIIECGQRATGFGNICLTEEESKEMLDLKMADPKTAADRLTVLEKSVFVMLGIAAGCIAIGMVLVAVYF